jgi:hypothetical protein
MKNKSPINVSLIVNILLIIFLAVLTFVECLALLPKKKPIEKNFYIEKFISEQLQGFANK